MKLKCNIHGIEFNIVQGATFSDNYNETLDSGTIIIDHIEKIDDLRPYDDVFIYEENADFFGYANASNANAPLTRNYFYKHLLIDRYSEERLNPIENIFKYKIELFSETKKLETICLPNISITEPLEYEKKISVWEYLNMYVEQYSPKIKIQVSDIQADNTFKWDYVRKYKILPELESVFSSCFPPDFTLNTPNLRDVLSKLMQVKDMIPYVQDDFICGLDITKRTGDFNVNGITTITSNMSSAEYVDNLRRNYSNALSQDKTCRLIEHMGFRNSSSALMTLENMRLETRYPIYKINRILMCYYKKVKIKNHLNSQDEREAIFLCKQDITPLVVLSRTRSLLNARWDDFTNFIRTYNTTASTEDIAKYKMATLSYDIGSNYITGWGEKYTYINSNALQGDGNYWWKYNTTTIQNILQFLDDRYPYGLYDAGYLVSDSSDYVIISDDSLQILNTNPAQESMVSPAEDRDTQGVNEETRKNYLSANIAAKLKSLFFEMDYTAFYNGSIIHSKEGARDDIVVNDNSTTSLAILEQEGIYQKSKANRLGNKTFLFNARYSGDFNSYQNISQLGSVYRENIKYQDIDQFGEEDIIIFQREYSIFDDYIVASYTGSKSAVLKNYFYSVLAKHRTWNLMSYEESVNRAENKKNIILLSKNKCINTEENNLSFYNFVQNDYIIEENNGALEQENSASNNYKSKFINFLNETPKANTKGVIKLTDNINCGIYKINDQFYFSDVNVFACGDSICFNLKMFDNVSGGVYIEQLEPDVSFAIFTAQNTLGDYSGTSQQNYMLNYQELENGSIYNLMSFYLLHNDLLEEEKIKQAEIYEDTSSAIQEIKTSKYNKLFCLPKIELPSDAQNWENSNNIIEYSNIFNKDNKECIDMTIQFEYCSDNEDIIITPWLPRLSNLLSSYNKVLKTYYSKDNVYSEESVVSPIPLAINYRVYPDAYNTSNNGSTNPIRLHYNGYGMFIDSSVLYNDIINYKNKTLSTSFRIRYDATSMLNQLSWSNRRMVNLTTKKGCIAACDFNVRRVKFSNMAQNHNKYKVTLYGDLSITTFSQTFLTYRFNYTNTVKNYSIELWEYKRDDIETEDAKIYFNNWRGSYEGYNPIFTDNGAIEGWRFEPRELDKPLMGEYAFEDFIYNDDLGNRIDHKPFFNSGDLVYKVYDASLLSVYPYPQNMFICYSTQKVAKSMIYDDYKQLPDIPLNSILDDSNNSIFSTTENEHSVNYIFIDLKKISAYKEIIKSLTVFYYLNEDSIKSYNKTKNINFNTEDIIIKKSDFSITHKDYTFSKIIDSNCVDIDVTTPDEAFAITDKKYTPETGELTFKIKYTVWPGDPEYATSVSLTLYKYNYKETLKNGSYKFVFGVNVNEEDWEKGYIKIYCSFIQSRDERVYDSNRMQIGEVYNFAEEGNTKDATEKWAKKK